MDKSTTIELIDFILESIRLIKVADKNYWSRIIKTRDFISHHYVDIDSETVFDICSNELQKLEIKVGEIRGYLK